MIHGGKLILHAMTLEQRNRIGILLYPPRMAGHQQFHEVLGCLIAILALDQHFLYVALVHIANSSLDEVAVIVNEFRRGRSPRFFAYFVPHASELITIAFDPRLCPLKPTQI